MRGRRQRHGLLFLLDPQAPTPFANTAAPVSGYPAALVCLAAGTDGCSEPVSLLVSDGLSQSTAFVSPKVATLSRVNFNSLVS